MSFCSRANAVKIGILVLLAILLIVGVFWFMRSSDDESDQPSSLHFIPKLQQGSLIKFKVTDRASFKAVTNAIEEDLKPYNSTNPNIYKGCNFYNSAPAGKTCEVDLKAFNPCTKELSFGYNKGTPCVFLKLSKDPKWIPEFYNESKLDDAMPMDLKEDIKNYISTTRKHAQMVWVSCEGKTPADNGNIGPVIYLPRRGFAGFYFPCRSEDNCTEPLVAVFFEKPKSQVVINVQCKIWAQNLHDTVDFELFVE